MINAALLDSNVTAIERRAKQGSRSVSQQQTLAHTTVREVARMPIGRDWLIKLMEMFVDPLALVASLFTVALIVHGELSTRHVLFAIVVFSFAFRGYVHLTKTLSGVARHIILSWFIVSGLLFLCGWATDTLSYFNPNVLIIWWCVAPVSQFAAHFLLRRAKPALARLQGPPRRAVVVGVNEQGIELAKRLGRDHYTRSLMIGFFDDRADNGHKMLHGFPVLGKLQGLVQFVNAKNIDVIYVSLPMQSQPRILALLDELRDTTASIYFVPDPFITDLVNGRVDSVQGMPVLAVCETPFTGLDGVSKRVSDVVLSLIILVLLSPLLLVIALGVKLSSPGPVIFRQRRYGLDGHDIVVYKFRTMTVTEDGNIIRQARNGDSRVTRFGAFLRKTSLDEFPQFINVLQGRMSIVGPRPHAVAHNEMYRKLISGYMLRHKVRPGITGWAQINGLRGETETLDKMKKRVDYDLDYLRNWSQRFDLYIIAKTVWVVLKGKDAY